MNNAKVTPKHFSFIFMFALGWAGILNTGWLFTSYYSLAQGALGLDDAAMGILVSITDGMGLWGYLVSGPIADWLKPKLSMDIGVVLTIAGAVLLIVSPTSSMAFICCIIMATSGVVFYCTAGLRLIATYGPREVQGQALGYFYAFQGVVMLVEGTILSSVINATSPQQGLSFLLIFSCITMVISQVSMHFYDKTPWLPQKGAAKEKSEGGFSVAMIGKLFQNSRVWVLMLICMATNATAMLITYTQPLLASQFGVSTGTVTMISTWTNQATLLVLSVCTGILVDKLGSATKVVLLSFGCLFVGVAIVLIVPWQAKFLVCVIAAICFIRAVNSICKPARQSLISECGIPDTYRGTIIGVMNVVMALPGTVLGTVFGRILTHYDGARTGYQIIYGIFAVIGVIGVISVLAFQKLKKAAEQKG